MKILKSIIYWFFLKKYIRNKYKFLNEYSFIEIRDKEILKTWDNTFVLYKRKNIIISLGFDYKDDRFTTFFFDEERYEISTNYSFYLKDYLLNSQNINNFYKLTQYKGINDYEKTITDSADMLKKNIFQICNGLDDGTNWFGNDTK